MSDAPVRYDVGDVVVVLRGHFGRFTGRVYMVDRLHTHDGVVGVGVGVMTPSGTGVVFPTSNVAQSRNGALASAMPPCEMRRMRERIGEL